MQGLARLSWLFRTIRYIRRINTYEKGGKGTRLEGVCEPRYGQWTLPGEEILNIWTG